MNEETVVPGSATDVTTTTGDTTGTVTPPSAPEVTAAPEHAPELLDTDTASDGISSTSLPVFVIADTADGETANLYVDGLNVSAAFDADRHTLTPSEPIVDGHHQVGYTLTIFHSGESAVSPLLDILIDTTAAALPAVTDPEPEPAPATPATVITDKTPEQAAAALPPHYPTVLERLKELEAKIETDVSEELESAKAHLGAVITSIENYVKKIGSEV